MLLRSRVVTGVVKGRSKVRALSSQAPAWIIHKGEEMRETMKEYGLCVYPGLLDQAATVRLEESLLAPALKILDEIPKHGIGIGSRLSFFEVVQRSPGRFDVPIALDAIPKLEEETLKAAAEVAAGEEVELAFCGVVVAQPGSSAQEWHIDSLHESEDLSLRPNLINILIPLLTDVSQEMGPTELVPGSHMHTNHLVPSVSFGPEIAYQDKGNSPALLKNLSSAVVTPAGNEPYWRRGDALVFDDRILHRGGANHLSKVNRCVAYASYRRREAKASTHFEAFRSMSKFSQEASTVAHGVRPQFPGLTARPTHVVCDGAGGSQVPLPVVQAVSKAMLYSAANVGGLYAASESATSTVEIARKKFAAFFKHANQDEIIFGANATTINAHLGNAIFPTFAKEGKTNILISAMDHDSNGGLWAHFAQRFQLQIKVIPLSTDGASLDLVQASHLIDSNTAMVAVGLASNGLGSIHDVATLSTLAKDHGALCFVDAVHAAPHIRLDLKELAWPDFIVCSPYKFFGPHLGVLYASREALLSLEPDKLPVADNGLPSAENCFMSPMETGTQQFENIAGAAAALDYLASIGQRFGGIDSVPVSLFSLQDEITTPNASPPAHDLSTLLDAAFFVIAHQESLIKKHFLEGVADMSPRLRVLGHTHWDDPRTSTFAIDIKDMTHEALTEALVKHHGIICTSGNHYCTFWQEKFGIPGATRLSFLHYNTLEEVETVLHGLNSILSSSSSST